MATCNDLDERPSLALHRFYPVAPEKVWRAWTDPQALRRWFGPGGPQPVASAELDVRVGGRFRVLFGGPAGTEHEVQGVYREVVPNRRLVFTWVWPRTTPERESLVTIEFRKAGRGTELVFTHAQHFDERVRDDHRQGWSESFVKLEHYLKTAGEFKMAPRGEREIVMTRVFNAPRRKVWDALTKLEHLKRWLGVFGGWSLAVCEIDLKPGGAYRFVWRGADGTEMGMGGVYREIVPPQRFVATERFDEPWYPGEALVTQVLSEQGGKTTLTVTLRYESGEARDGVLKSPMEGGVQASYDRLAEVLA